MRCNGGTVRGVVTGKGATAASDSNSSSLASAADSTANGSSSSSNVAPSGRGAGGAIPIDRADAVDLSDFALAKSEKAKSSSVDALGNNDVAVLDAIANAASDGVPILLELSGGSVQPPAALDDVLAQACRVHHAESGASQSSSDSLPHLRVGNRIFFCC